eukprot:5018472-Alexandrium_andersonii.AAC.1
MARNNDPSRRMRALTVTILEWPCGIQGEFPCLARLVQHGRAALGARSAAAINQAAADFTSLEWCVVGDTR